ncbi:hypothetical protein FALBO_11283 [Fusarium albosuccineum]|uniref:HNH nuclease domain-containing protein n=1 Tax=Fusarium albosuccineum TaxID=1237068 RepID=A0A8H4L685_9HYPO|nr:hypothetical protein FALBO_11283 [Fusarium albosuccineum]
MQAYKSYSKEEVDAAIFPLRDRFEPPVLVALKAVGDKYSLEQLKTLASLAEKLPGPGERHDIHAFLKDAPPASEQIHSYVDDLDERRDIIREWLKEGDELNAAILSVVMVAPLDQLRNLRNQLLLYTEHFKPMRKQLIKDLRDCCALVMMTYLPKGGLPPKGLQSLSRPPSTAGSSSPPIPRSGSATKDAKTRDRHKCIIAGTSDTQGAHIFPYAKSSNFRASYMKTMLAQWWGQDQANRWADLIRSKGETAQNRLSLNHQIRWWWDRAKFAFKPLRQVGNTIVIQFHWLKQSELKPDSSINSGFMEETGLAGESGARWGKGFVLHESGHSVKTGQIFTITAKNQDDLPSFDLLQLQWDLHRVAAMCGAANVTDEDLENLDFDGPGLDILLKEVKAEQEFSGHGEASE